VRPGGLAARNFAVVARQGGVLFAIMAAVSCTYGFDNLLTLHWLGAAASARMTVALRLCTTGVAMIGVVTQPLWPAFVDASARGDTRWAMRMLCWSSAGVAVLAGGGAMTIGCLGAPLLQFWLRQDIGMRSVLLWACAAWIFAFCITRVPSLLFNAVSILRLQLSTALSALGLAVALKFMLAPPWGAAGILVATPIAWALIAWPAFAWRLGIWVKDAALRR
jgi:O-antigen/teichoic acid export membrane protein